MKNSSTWTSYISTILDDALQRVVTISLAMGPTKAPLHIDPLQRKWTNHQPNIIIHPKP